MKAAVMNIKIPFVIKKKSQTLFRKKKKIVIFRKIIRWKLDDSNF